MNFSEDTVSVPDGLPSLENFQLVLHNYPAVEDTSSLRGYEGRVYAKSA